MTQHPKTCESKTRISRPCVSKRCRTDGMHTINECDTDRHEGNENAIVSWALGLSSSEAFTLTVHLCTFTNETQQGTLEKRDRIYHSRTSRKWLAIRTPLLINLLSFCTCFYCITEIALFLILIKHTSSVTTVHSVSYSSYTLSGLQHLREISPFIDSISDFFLAFFWQESWGRVLIMRSSVINVHFNLLFI